MSTVFNIQRKDYNNSVFFLSSSSCKITLPLETRLSGMIGFHWTSKWAAWCDPGLTFTYFSSGLINYRVHRGLALFHRWSAGHTTDLINCRVLRSTGPRSPLVAGHTTGLTYYRDHRSTVPRSPSVSGSYYRSTDPGNLSRSPVPN